MNSRTASGVSGRAALLVAAGLLLGFAIGRAVKPSPKGNGGAEAAAAEHSGGSNGALARHDTSVAEASKIILGDITRVPFQELYSVMSLHPPKELAQIAKQLHDLPPGVETTRRIEAFYKAWSHIDARSALAAAVQFDTIDERTAAIGAVIDAADATVIPSLAHAIDELTPGSLPPERKRAILGAAALKWSDLDPPAAVKFLELVSAGAGKMFADWHTLSRNWAATDPAAALAWAQEHDAVSGGPFNFATNGAVAGWWQRDPQAAEAYVAAEASGANQQLASTLASFIANSDPQRAMEWVRQLSNADARRSASAIIATQLGWTDPKAASEWAVGLPASDRSMAIQSAIGEWTRSDPKALRTGSLD